MRPPDCRVTLHGFGVTTGTDFNRMGLTMMTTHHKGATMANILAALSRSTARATRGA